nr:ABC transporter substrate-binding protein [Anaerolineae bacterium]
MEENLHKWIPELQEQLRQGKMTRREFLRYATLLGVSLATARALAACAPKPAPTPTPAPATPTPTPVPPTPTPIPAVIRGGTLRVRGMVGRIDHPARYSWVANSNTTRHVAEYLTFTDENNVTHPYLLEKWEASEDLKTWTLYLRKGIKWNNGDDFVADDVVFSMKQWLDPEVGSSILGLMAYLKPANIEKVDNYTVRLHLDAPQIAVPEHLFHYPAQVMNHRTFEGDFIKAPVGTGPFILEEYSEGERVVLKRRTDPPYWRTGVDGKPLPYLDEIIYVDLGGEASAHIAAMQAGEIDVISEPDTEHFLALKDDPNLQVIGTPAAMTRVLRM